MVLLSAEVHVTFKSIRLLGLGVGMSLMLALGCTPGTSGALGPSGYEQAVVKYQVPYSDPAAKKFLPDDWTLDNYAYDSSKGEWIEKKGHDYRATRWLDENGDGTVSRSERKDENIFDLRFVNNSDGAVIWIKVHPLAFADSKRNLEVVLENYADGLTGTGLFEQSSLFSLKTDTAREFTTFIVSKKAIWVGRLAAIRGVIEIADVVKLRLDPAHRDSKAELVFARVKYLGEPSETPIRNSLWPVVPCVVNNVKGYAQVRTELLVMGYYNDAVRFDSHLADFHALRRRIVIPASAVPDFNAPPTIQVAPTPTPGAPESPAAVPVASPTAAPSTPPPAPASAQAPVPDVALPASPAARHEATTAPASPKPEASSVPPSPNAKPEASAPATNAK